MRRVVVVASLTVLALAACSAQAGPEPAPGLSRDETEMCAAWWLIVDDAANRVDTLAETRDRLRDLYDEYQYRDVRASLLELIEENISAMTRILEGADASVLDEPLDRLAAACKL